MPMPKSKNLVGLGRAIINKKAKDARQPRDNEKYLADLDPSSRLRSVTQERDLDEFLNTAELAGTEFTAERQNIRIIQAPGASISSAHNPFLLTSQEEREALRKHAQHKQKLRVPRRPPWTKQMTRGELERQERDSFLNWRRGLADLQESEDLLFTPFERNIEVWRQLWRVLERSHLVVQIVDARNPLRFRCEDLEAYVQDIDKQEQDQERPGWKRNSLLLINKADLLNVDQRRAWADYFDSQNIRYTFFSAANAQALQEARREAELEAAQQENNKTDVEDGLRDLNLQTEASGSEDESESDTHAHGIWNDDDGNPRTKVLSVLELEALFLKSAPDISGLKGLDGSPAKLVVGLVGYPNVGKSSTINSLLGEKKVSVSSTPGKTKHFQTIRLSPSIILCDCPGLVFPQFATTKADLVCDGVLPIDQLREHTAPVALLTHRIPRRVLERTYGLSIKRHEVDPQTEERVLAEDLLIAYAIARGFMRAGQGNPDEARAARYILKDYVNAKLLYCHPPPSVSSDTFNARTWERKLQLLEISGKRKAPTTRVGKGANTYIAPNADGDQALVQGPKSQTVDNLFFGRDPLSGRPSVAGAKAAAAAAREEGVLGKKHFKQKRTKQRSGKGYD